jgi:hypothetical protein
VIAAICLVLVSFAPAAAQANPDRLTIQDVFNLELASDPQISPE